MTSTSSQLIGPAVVGERAIRARPGDTIRHVCTLLSQKGASAVLLDDPGAPVGIVTLSDVAAAIGAGADPDTVRAADISSGRRGYVPASERVADVVATMVRDGSDDVLVMDADGLVGVASLRRLVARWLLDAEPLAPRGQKGRRDVD